jgi:hypothetical protein
VFGPVKVAMVYTDFDGDAPVAGTDVSRRTWQIGADWKITGPGTIRFAYTNADDFKGTAAAAAAQDQGAQQYSIHYIHALSKRTSWAVYYVNVDNDTNGVYNYHGFTSAVKPGDSASAFALQLTHTF